MKNWRINLIIFCFILAGIIILSRLFYLQIIKGEFYKTLYQGFNNFVYSSEERGEIFFKNGEPLAINKTFFYLLASPEDIKNKEDVVKHLSKILNIEKEKISDKLKSSSLGIIIKHKLSDEEVENIKKLNIKGLYLKKEVLRYYPQKTLASKIIGFVDSDGKGRYGLEEYYENILSKKNEKGGDLILTIDYNLQRQAEKILEKANKDYAILSGQIIIINPQTGEILAMADYPNFDPNEYEKYAENLNIFMNGATEKLFEPGSVLKSITMASALNEGRITPETTYFDPGKIRIGNHTIYNFAHHQYGGPITMTTVLEKSINTGAVFAKDKLGNSDFLKYLERFGLFEKTGIDLDEVYSANNELKKQREINLATAAFGQGIEMTPIQLVRAYSALTNQRSLPKLYVVKKIVEEGKTTIIEPEFSEPIISSDTVNKLAGMLINVVENGYAKATKIKGYYIAGKTGTAQVPDKGGYSEKTIQSFVGFFPAFNPQFLILIKLDNPNVKTAEYCAVPLFGKLAEYIIHFYKIPPDYE